MEIEVYGGSFQSSKYAGFSSGDLKLRLHPHDPTFLDSYKTRCSITYTSIFNKSKTIEFSMKIEGSVLPKDLKAESIDFKFPVINVQDCYTVVGEASISMHVTEYEDNSKTKSEKEPISRTFKGVYELNSNSSMVPSDKGTFAISKIGTEIVKPIQPKNVLCCTIC
jgi:hypothetical protein